jgi:tRNA-Thr(GGU) m(6)t(6)A37 methyltransferase TsaA
MITVQPIGFVRCERTDVRDDFWGGITAAIELAPDLQTDSLDGLDEYSHAEVIFVLDKVPAEAIAFGARIPRNNPAWPKVGIFAQRAKARPNRLGTTIVRILARDGRRLLVAGLDAIDGTPVLDIKPVLAEFLPTEEVRQPAWSHELMQNYWSPASERPGNG